MEIKKQDLIKQLRIDMGRQGGQQTLLKYGKKHFKDMADKRWAKRYVDKSAIASGSKV